MFDINIKNSRDISTTVLPRTLAALISVSWPDQALSKNHQNWQVEMQK